MSPLQMVLDRPGFSLPLADLYFSTSYPGLTDNLEGGFYGGDARVGDAGAHRQDVDWQFWIEEGDRPFQSKLSIIYKRLPGSPQFTAVISDWDFSPALAAEFFTFRPPDVSSRIEFLSEPAGGGLSGGEE